MPTDNQTHLFIPNALAWWLGRRDFRSPIKKFTEENLIMCCL